jgi:NTE family protein
MAQDALARVFVKAGPPFTLRGGEALARPGQAVDALYRLEAGRIGELKPAADGASRLVAIHRPGALFGGVEILGDGVHHTALVALRDSNLRALPIRRAERLLRRDSHILGDVARAALRRLGAQTAETPRGASLLGFVSACDSIPMREFAERLAERLRALGKTTAVLGRESADFEPARLSQVEEAHDLVIFAAERGEREFIAFCARQIDRLVVVGSTLAAPPVEPLPLAAHAVEANRLVDLVLVQAADCAAVSGSEAWLKAVPASRLFHVRRDDSADLARIARIYAGRSVGLVLSGGGARAYAHVGVIKALTELGVPIDFLAGTSMGAIVAAGMAMGWSVEELDARLRAAFVTTSPLGDISFPLVALSRGREVEARLKQHFGETRISDLWRPFACVSTDLTTGGEYVHHRGQLRHALRCSLSLPGVLPPMVENGHVLVDGALVANLPVDLVQGSHDGWTIGVDVAQAEGLHPADLKLNPSGWAWIASGAWRRGPPIVSVLMRAATVGAEWATAATRRALDLTIMPAVEGVELRDWKAYDAAVKAGYSATLAVADQLAPMSA